MMNKTEIQQRFLALHDALGTRKDADDKELFDQQHTQIWHDCDVELRARKGELKAKTSLSKDEKLELGNLTMMFPEPTLPARDLCAEIDEIRSEIANLKAKEL